MNLRGVAASWDPHLGVRARVSNDKKARLAELLGDLVGERSWGETPRDGQAAGVLSELEHRTLAVRASGDGHNVLLCKGTTQEKK